MIVHNIQCSSLDIATFAGLTCTANEEKVMTTDDRAFIKSLIDKGHESVLEHLVFSFYIVEVSRAVLQELSRHRIASYSVQSTRWALKKLYGDEGILPPYVYALSEFEGRLNETQLEIAEDIEYRVEELFRAVGDLVESGAPNDLIKYYLPESVMTNVVMTINARSLRNLFKLRTAPEALWEFQLLAKLLFKAIPDTHKFLFEDCTNGQEG